MEGGKDEEYQAVLDKAIARLKQLEVSKGWVENGVKPCPMFKMEVQGRIASKGIDKVNYNIQKVIAFLDQEASLKKINPMLLEIKVLYNVEDKFRVNYMLYKGIWPVDNRDFVNVGGKLRESDNKIYIATAACNFPHAQVKGAVRGEVYVGGYVIEKIDENTTQISYFSDADLKGKIPGMIKNTVSSKQGEIASKVGIAMQKDGL